MYMWIDQEKGYVGGNTNLENTMQDKTLLLYTSKPGNTWKKWTEFEKNGYVGGSPNLEEKVEQNPIVQTRNGWVVRKGQILSTWFQT